MQSWNLAGLELPGHHAAAFARLSEEQIQQELLRRGKLTLCLIPC